MSFQSPYDEHKMLTQFQCDQCDYKARYKGHLLAHIKSKHEGVKFPCELCDYKASWKVDLRKHIKFIHEE